MLVGGGRLLEDKGQTINRTRTKPIEYDLVEIKMKMVF